MNFIGDIKQSQAAPAAGTGRAVKFGMDRAGKAAETKAVLGNNAAAGESLPGAELQDAALQEETLQGEAVKDEVLNRALNTLTENRCRESRIHLWPPEIAEKIGHPLIVGIAQDLESARSEVKIGDGIVVLGEIAEENEICAIARRLPAWGASGVWFLPAGTVVNEKLSDSFNTFVELENFPAERKNFSAENEIVPAIKNFFTLLAERLGRESSRKDPQWVCITCSDEGRLAEILEPHPQTFSALARTACGEEEIDVMLVGEVRRADLVLIHAQGAIARVN